jgi:hypothetical protein
MTGREDTVAVPPRYSRVDPWVISLDTEAEIRFLEDVDPAELTSRFADRAAVGAMTYVRDSLTNELSTSR